MWRCVCRFFLVKIELLPPVYVLEMARIRDSKRPNDLTPKGRRESAASVPKFHHHIFAGGEFAARRSAQEGIRAAQAKERVRLLAPDHAKHSALQSPAEIMRPIGERN